MKILPILVILFCATNSYGFGSIDKAFWDQTQKVTYVANLTVLIADWAQTRYVARHPEKYSEKGAAALLPEHPKESQVDMYFVGLILIDLAVQYLPNKVSSVWNTARFSEHLSCIVNNNNIGIKIRF